jgi:tRNA C32,U32 (ribose-2'-O)-methylase TrmJ
MATVDPQYSEESSSWSSDEEDNSSESESESESEAASAELTSESVCEECSFKDRQIEQLRQKLEHAVHMNKLLSQECQRLKGAVRKAKWKSGRSRYGT